MKIPFLIVTAILVCLSGCRDFPDNPPVERDGRRYGVVEGQFRHRWWNYYERGISFAEGEVWDRAETDFREAIRQYDQDRRRVPTYGHHLADYFPHRELGIVLLHQGRLNEAIQELESSLNTETSARAQFYLDRARRDIVNRDRLDQEPPTLRIALSDRLTNALSVTVSGEASDDTYVAAITVNDRPVRMDVSERRKGFSLEIPLDPGANPVRVEAADITGRISCWEDTVECDRSGPVLSLSMSQGRLRGYAHDASGIRSVTVDGESVPTGSGSEIALDRKVAETTDTSVEVVDAAGNRTQSVVPAAGNMRGIVPPEEAENVATEDLGTDHALIIGIDAYGNGWKPLQTARNDAEAVADMLIRRYGFPPENVHRFFDQAATWQEIIAKMRALAHCLDGSDNLLVYFAGHGELDDLTQDGYWIPVDGRVGDPSTWITNSSVRAIFGESGVRIKNLLLIADSCYSGTLLLSDPHRAPTVPGETPRFASAAPASGERSRRNATDRAPDLASRMSARRPSREVISSGGIEPVSDESMEGHSRFARAVLTSLETNTDTLLDSRELYHRIYETMTARDGTGQTQRPAMGRLDGSVRTDGHFVFRLGSRSEKNGHPPCESAPSVSPADADPPDIQLSPGEGHVAYAEQLVIDIRASDSNGVQWISMGGEAVLTRPAHHDVSLTHILRLKEGENRIPIRYADQVGNVGEKTLTVFREIPLILSAQYRMPLLWRPFDLGNDDKNTGAEKWVRHYLNQAQRFHIHLAGMGESSSLSTSPHFEINGTITATQHEATIMAEVIDGEHGAILSTLDVYAEGGLTRATIEKKSRELALKIVDAFPRVQGRVASVSPDVVTLNRGEKDRLFPGLWVMFFDDSLPQTRDNPSLLGQGRVEETKRDTANAKPAIDTPRLSSSTGFIVK